MSENDSSVMGCFLSSIMAAKRHRAGKVLPLLLAGVAAALFLSSCAQDKFYYPVRGQSAYTPNDAGLSHENVYFNSADGTRLHGWFIPAVGEMQGVVLHVHGNAGKLENHLGAILWLPRAHYAVLMFDYRGYGLSDDEKPATKALMEDTQAAIAYLKSRKDTAAQKLLILAQSLGGNNAIAAIARGNMKEIAGIVLDSTFYSYKTIASDKFPGAGLWVGDQYSASRFIGQLAPIPLFFMHGERDSVIPWQHSQKLFERAGDPKRIRIVPHAEHLRALEYPVIRADVLDFFAQSLQGKP